MFIFDFKLRHLLVILLWYLPAIGGYNFLKNVVPIETLFSAINLAYLEEMTFKTDYSNLRHLKKCNETAS